jgi:hypothetical protein
MATYNSRRSAFVPLRSDGITPSAAFDGLPGPAKEYVYRRLWEVLSGKDRSPELADLTMADRRAIVDILRATKPGLPSYWLKPTVIG